MFYRLTRGFAGRRSGKGDLDESWFSDRQVNGRISEPEWGKTPVQIHTEQLYLRSIAREEEQQE